MKNNDKYTRRHNDLFRSTTGFCVKSELTLLLVLRPMPLEMHAMDETDDKFYNGVLS